MTNNEESRLMVEARSVSMYPVHWATVDAYAKDAGYGSTSAALRRIIDEWIQLRQAQAAHSLHDQQRALRDIDARWVNQRRDRS